MYFVNSTSKLIRQAYTKRSLFQTVFSLNKSNLSSYTSHDLSNIRSIVKIRGRDSAVYLQNLISNDIHLLDDQSNKVIYSMMLNNRGRVMYDVLIYRLNQNMDEYLIELDKEFLKNFLQMSKMYKIRKKVEISTVDDQFKLYSLTNNKTNKPQDLEENNSSTNNLRIFAPDPRFPDLGFRIIKEIDSNNISDNFMNTIIENSDISLYKQELYKHGIAENHVDISYGNSIPLEYNLVLLNGVSFNKGCYLGQELIAKTHHTGVIRKRILPICFNEERSLDVIFEIDCNILNKKSGKSAGKLKNSSGNYGIAMLRLNELDKDNLVVLDSNKNEHSISFNIPSYWKNDEKLSEIIKKFSV